jgi:hypothetical protein
VSIVRIIGALDVGLFEQCLRYLTERHELLRTTFHSSDRGPVQIIHESGSLDLTFFDLIDVDDADERANLIVHEAALQPIDLTKLPISRYLLIRTDDDDYRFAQYRHRLISDGFTGRIFDEELAMLYEAKRQRLEPPLPALASLQYADFAVWQRKVSQPSSAYYKASMDWWRAVFMDELKTVRLPFRYFKLRSKLDPKEGVLPWTVEGATATRLDDIARRTKTTPYVIRLAAFAALLADASAKRKVMIGTLFQNRDRPEVQRIVGPLVNRLPLVFAYDPSQTFLRWVQLVHRRVFETLARSELPFDVVRNQLAIEGVKAPEFWIYCMASRDHSDRSMGGAVMHHELSRAGGMPGGCTVYIDEKKPEKCSVQFDARRYPSNDMKLLVKRYLRLLELAALEPEQTIGTLQKMVQPPKPLRWAATNYAWPVYDFYKDHIELRFARSIAWLRSLRTPKQQSKRLHTFFPPKLP